MKTRLFTIFLFIFSFSLVFAGGSKEADNSRNNEVVIYAYDSFCSEWGPGPAIVKAFEEKTGYKVTMISAGDAAQVLSKATFEKANPKSDVLIGIDNNLLDKAKSQNILESYKPQNADALIDSNLVLDSEWFLSPFDWSSFAMIFDSYANVPAPTCLSDLTKDIYKKKIILMDPRTSTPGLGFVAWTLAEYGLDGIEDFWKALKPNILTMAPGWDTGYGLFTSGEAPLVISYTTSPAYHIYDGEDYRYVALEFEKGHPMQIEGAGLVKNAKNPEGGKAFLDFLISKEAQEIIPETQWMYPINNTVELPSCYEVSPVPAKTLTVDQAELEKAVEKVLAILAG